MSVLELGTDPVPLTMRLNASGDFIAGLDLDDGGGWPALATLTLVFNDAEDTAWPATLVGVAADWAVDKAEVAALIERLRMISRPKAKLIYADGAVDVVWAEGAPDLTR